MKKAPKEKLPDFVAPELALPSETPPPGNGWLHELKLDGYRIQARKDGKKVKLLTRKGLDWTHRMRTIAALVAELPVEKDRRGHIVVDGTMRCRSHPEVWALGDCALIPAPDGTPYPNLAQHALREARVLARNIVGVLDGGPPQPFVYDTLGMMGSLGHGKAFGQLLGVRVRGVLAWFVRRTY